MGVPLWCSKCEKWTTEYSFLDGNHYECGHKVGVYQTKESANMDVKKAREVIKNNYPPEQYTMLREALDWLID